jgi:hypothetical protein
MIDRVRKHAQWIVDQDHPEKTRARILALVLGFIPLVMALVVATRR